MRKFGKWSYTLVFLGAISVQSIFAQLSNKQVKTLKETYENESIDIRDRWDAAYNLCIMHYVEMNPDSASFYAKEYYEGAAELRDTSNIIYALYAQYYAFSAKGEYTESISVLEEILSLCQIIGDRETEAIAQTGLGSTCVRIGEGEKGVEHLFLGAELFFEMQTDPSNRINLVNRMNLVNVLYSIANVYMMLNDPESAKPYLDLVQSYNPEFLGTRNSASQLNNLGYIHKELGGFDLAKTNFLDALALGTTFDPTYGRTLIGLGSVYREKGHMDSASFYFEKAIPIMAQANHHPEEVMALGGLGLVHVHDEEYEKALDCGLRAWPMAKSMGSLPHIILATKVLHEAYKGLEEANHSLEFYELHTKAKEKAESRDIYLQIKSKEFTKILESMEMTFLAEKNQTGATFRSKMIFFVVGFVLLLILLTFYFGRRLLKRKQERNSLMDELQNLQTSSLENREPNPQPEQKELGIKTLNKERIELAIGAKLNDTDWKILNALLNNPMITNRDIAQMIHLSIPGVRSSLQKMYRLFEINGNSSNRRIALLLAAARLGGD